MSFSNKRQTTAHDHPDLTKASFLPDINQTKARVHSYCATLGHESFSRLKEVARKTPALTWDERMESDKLLLCARLGTALGMDDLKTAVDAVHQDYLDSVSGKPLDVPVFLPSGNVYSHQTFLGFRPRVDPKDLTMRHLEPKDAVLALWVENLMTNHYRAFGNEALHELSTDLSSAVRVKDVQYARALLAAGADPNSLFNSYASVRRTVLDMALEIGYAPMVNILQKAGAQVSPTIREEDGVCFDEVMVADTTFDEWFQETVESEEAKDDSQIPIIIGVRSAPTTDITWVCKTVQNLVKFGLEDQGRILFECEAPDSQRHVLLDEKYVKLTVGNRNIVVREPDLRHIITQATNEAVATASSANAALLSSKNVPYRRRRPYLWLFESDTDSPTLVATVSAKVQLHGGSHVSTSHCQAGSQELVYRLRYVQAEGGQLLADIFAKAVRKFNEKKNNDTDDAIDRKFNMLMHRAVVETNALLTNHTLSSPPLMYAADILQHLRVQSAWHVVHLGGSQPPPTYPSAAEELLFITFEPTKARRVDLKAILRGVAERNQSPSSELVVYGARFGTFRGRPFVQFSPPAGAGANRPTYIVFSLPDALASATKVTHRLRSYIASKRHNSATIRSYYDQGADLAGIVHADDKGVSDTLLMLALRKRNFEAVNELLNLDEGNDKLNVNATNESGTKTALTVAIDVGLHRVRPDIFEKLIKHPEIDLNDVYNGREFLGDYKARLVRVGNVNTDESVVASWIAGNDGKPLAPGADVVGGPIMYGGGGGIDYLDFTDEEEGGGDADMEDDNDESDGEEEENGRSEDEIALDELRILMHHAVIATDGDIERGTTMPRYPASFLEYLREDTSAGMVVYGPSPFHRIQRLRNVASSPAVRFQSEWAINYNNFPTVLEDFPSSPSIPNATVEAHFGELSSIRFIILTFNNEAQYIIFGRRATIMSAETMTHYLLEYLADGEGDFPTVRRYISQGANVHNGTDEDGNTALMFTVNNLNISILEGLLNNGMINGEDVRIQNNAGDSAISLAVAADMHNNNTELYRELIRLFNDNNTPNNE